MQYCCLQSQTLLPSPVTSTTEHCFCFGSVPSLFLVLILYWSLVAYWTLTHLGSSSFSFLSFYLLILFTDYNTSNKTSLAEQNNKYKHLPALQKQACRSAEFDMCAEDKSPDPIWMNLFTKKKKKKKKNFKCLFIGLPWWLMVKNLSVNARDKCLISDLGRSHMVQCI